jgi:hypothetical protein
MGMESQVSAPRMQDRRDPDLSLEAAVPKLEQGARRRLQEQIVQEVAD